MKRLLKKAFLVAGVTAVAAGATLAFFSDSETSTGNTFVAGDLDLTIDNESWYYGPEGLVFREDLSWELSDLTGQLFFNYSDLKPGDWGEDTISFHVTNDSWLCADLNLTANSDVDCTDPELLDDQDCLNPDEGDLADEVYFWFWWDDGDNVFEFIDDPELGEPGVYDDGIDTPEGGGILTSGPAIDVMGGATWAIADSTTGTGPLIASNTYYIGKFWCYGDGGMNPVWQEGDAFIDEGNDPSTAGPGFWCDGEPVDNASQSDMFMGDVTFYAEQWRHNEQFVCEQPIQV